MPEDIWKAILDNSLVRSTSDEDGENPPVRNEAV